MSSTLNLRDCRSAILRRGTFESRVANDQLQLFLALGNTNFQFWREHMDSSSENLIAATELDSADSVVACPRPVQASVQLQQLRPSILDLNGIFFIILTGLAAVFTVAAFLISAR